MCSPSAPSAPTSTSQTTIPEYAKPTAERLVGRAEALSEAEYVPFEGQRLAAQTPEQQAITQRILEQQAPGQFQTGTTLSTAGGIGALGLGGQAARAGEQYMTNITDPNQIQSLMSPYMQNVVDIQKQQAIRDARQGQLGQNLAAARQGTYGGARQTLAMTERERNLQDQMAKIQAAGSQAAYEQAMKNLQFGSELGLKGQQTGLQGVQQATQSGAVLGQLGIGEQQTFGQLAQLQSAAAGQEQAQRQRELDLAYQDFITQQQMPYKQLGFLSDILRGSASLAATGGKTVYEQQPSPLSSVVGPGLAALGAYREFGRS
jgi:hypothetical protein